MIKLDIDVINNKINDLNKESNYFKNKNFTSVSNSTLNSYMNRIKNSYRALGNNLEEIRKLVYNFRNEIENLDTKKSRENISTYTLVEGNIFMVKEVSSFESGANSEIEDYFLKLKETGLDNTDIMKILYGGESYKDIIRDIVINGSETRKNNLAGYNELKDVGLLNTDIIRVLSGEITYTDLIEQIVYNGSDEYRRQKLTNYNELKEMGFNNTQISQILTGKADENLKLQLNNKLEDYAITAKYGFTSINSVNEQLNKLNSEISSLEKKEAKTREIECTKSLINDYLAKGMDLNTAASMCVVAFKTPTGEIVYVNNTMSKNFVDTSHSGMTAITYKELYGSSEYYNELKGLMTIETTKGLFGTTSTKEVWKLGESQNAFVLKLNNLDSSQESLSETVKKLEELTNKRDETLSIKEAINTEISERNYLKSFMNVPNFDKLSTYNLNSESIIQSIKDKNKKKTVDAYTTEVTYLISDKNEEVEFLAYMINNSATNGLNQLVEGQIHDIYQNISVTSKDGLVQKMSKYIPFMSDEEKKIFNSICNSNDPDKVDKAIDFLNHIKVPLDRKWEIATSLKESEWATSSIINSTLATLSSPFMKPFEGANAFINSTKARINNESILYSDVHMTSSTMTSAIGNYIANEQYDENGKLIWKGSEGLSFTYGVTSSILDQAPLYLLAAATGGTSAALNASMTALTMGSSAFGVSLNENLKRGLTDDKAYGLAIGSAIIETATEYASLSTFLDYEGVGSKAIQKTLDKFATSSYALAHPIVAKAVPKLITVGGNMFVQGLSEGDEEALSEVLNTFLDGIVNKNNSEFENAVSVYMSEGSSEEEAINKALKDFAGQVGMAWLGGFVSGNFFGGVKGVQLSKNASNFANVAADQAPYYGNYAKAYANNINLQNRIQSINEKWGSIEFSDQMVEELLEEADDALKDLLDEIVEQASSETPKNGAYTAIIDGQEISINSDFMKSLVNHLTMSNHYGFEVSPEIKNALESAKKIDSSFAFANNFDEILDAAETKLNSLISQVKTSENVKAVADIITSPLAIYGRIVSVDVTSSPEMSNKILTSGLYHITTEEAAPKILESGYVKASDLITSYGRKKAYFFTANPEMQDVAININNFSEKYTAIKFDIDEEGLNAFRFRQADDNAVTHLGNYNFKEGSAHQVYLCLVEENGKLFYKEMTKEQYDNYKLSDYVSRDISKTDYFISGFARQYDYTVNRLQNLINKVANNVETISEGTKTIDSTLNNKKSFFDSLKEEVEIIDVSEMKPKKLGLSKNANEIDFSSSYQGFNYVIRPNQDLNTTLNSIIENNDGSNILVEIKSLSEISQETLNKMPDNVSLRIANYTNEHYESSKNPGPTANSTLTHLTYSKSELIAIMSEISNLESKIDPSWSDIDKAKFVYEYLRDNIRYTDETGGNNLREKQFDGLMSLVKKESTCQGFAHTFKMIMDRLKIECYEVWGDALNSAGNFNDAKTRHSHAYNIVKIDGNIFLVDSTREALNNMYGKYEGSGFGVVDLYQYKPRLYKDLFESINFNISSLNINKTQITFYDEGKRPDSQYDFLSYVDGRTLYKADNITLPNGKILYGFRIDHMNIYSETDLLNINYSSKEVFEVIFDKLLTTDKVTEAFMIDNGYIGNLEIDKNGNYMLVKSVEMQEESKNKKKQYLNFFEDLRKNNPNADFGANQRIEGKNYISYKKGLFGEGYRINLFNRSTILNNANYLANSYNMDINSIFYTMVTLDNTGACSYANQVNQIFLAFKDSPERFKEVFGYDMYVTLNGKKVLNSQTLLTDLYLFANSEENGGRLFARDENGKLQVIQKNNDYQTYMSNKKYGTNLKVLNNFLRRTNQDIVISNEHLSIKNEPLSDIKIKIKSALLEGRTISVSQYIEENYKPIVFYSLDGKKNKTTNSWLITKDGKLEGSGHITTVMDATDEGLIVDSWGEKYLIKFSDLDTTNCVFDIQTYHFDEQLNPDWFGTRPNKDFYSSSVKSVKQIDINNMTVEELRNFAQQNPYEFKIISKTANNQNVNNILEELSINNHLFSSELNSLTQKDLIDIVNEENKKFNLRDMLYTKDKRGIGLITPSVKVITNTFVRSDDKISYGDHGENMQALYKALYGRKELYDRKALWQENVTEDSNIAIQFTDDTAIIWVPENINLYQYNQLKALNEEFKTILDGDKERFKNYRFYLSGIGEDVNLDEYLRSVETKLGINEKTDLSKTDGMEVVEDLERTEELNNTLEMLVDIKDYIGGPLSETLMTETSERRDLTLQEILVKKDELYKIELRDPEIKKIMEGQEISYLSPFRQGQLARAKELELEINSGYGRVNNLETEQAIKIGDRTKANIELKNELLKSVEGITDPVIKARKLYMELNKKVHYDNTFVTGTNDTHELMMSQEALTIESLNESRTLICKGWSEIYKELLIDAGFDEADISINGKQHNWVEIKLGDAIIIADATEMINKSIDLTSSKAGFKTNGFAYLHSSFSGVRLSKLDMNQYGKFIAQSDSTLLKIDESLGYASKGKYLDEQIKVSKSKFGNSLLAAKLFGKNELSIVEEIMKLEVPEEMDGYEAFAYYQRIITNSLGKEKIDETMKFGTIYDFNQRQKDVYVEPIFKLTYTASDGSNKYYLYGKKIGSQTMSEEEYKSHNYRFIGGK